MKLILNICVIFFLYKLITYHHPNDKSRDTNLHTHDVKETRKSTTFYPGYSSLSTHEHVFLENNYVGQHSHTSDNNAPIIRPDNYKKTNKYVAGYDIQLEYFFKVFIAVIVIFCAVVGTNAF